MNRLLIKYFPIINTVKNYRKEYFPKDFIAALTVTAVAVPQSMAYALIAGFNPVYGLYTAIISAVFGSAFGSSNHLVTGPTNAICLLTASALSKYMGLVNAYQMLFLMTFLAGALQVLYGLLRLGKLVDFVSHTVLVGFTAGAGVLIALGQINTLLSISIKNSAELSTLQKMYFVSTHLSQTNLYALGLGLLTVLLIVICKKISKSLPGPLIGIVVPILVVIVFALETKGVKLTGMIPSSLPPFKMVYFSLDSLQHIFSGALAISIIGLVEAISISKAISSTTHQKIDSNQEFIGQGLANIAGSFFQCLPASGSFTRSAINFVNGAVTRFSGILSGIIIALVLVFLAPFARYIPSPCLAGVLIMTGYNLIDKHEIKKVLQVGKLTSDSIAMWATFLAVILSANIDYAIYLGIALSIALHLKDTNKVTVKLFIPAQGEDSQGQIVGHRLNPAEQKLEVLIVQLEGNLYFGSASALAEKLNTLANKSRAYILEMKYVSALDFTALNILKSFIKTVRESGGVVIISGVQPELSLMLKKLDIISDIGLDNIITSENEVFALSNNALERARSVLNCERESENPSIATPALKPRLTAQQIS